MYYARVCTDSCTLASLFSSYLPTVAGNKRAPTTLGMFLGKVEAKGGRLLLHYY
jgi:hypothetical protein